MNDTPHTPKEHLTLALAYYEIAVTAWEGNHVTLAHGYEIEIEKGFLFRLSCEGKVIAPFDDLDEMCAFILKSFRLRTFT